ncbi:PREDICTED: immunoglobulin superfamily member 5 [Chrysochloris asiatica]|uniref:immunoglobulin superfamily member 5 n=1 Tax=Chrysochloris asiatica TaxID=185453 RepID=UPI0003F14027|nr:PREDICTED: immunoglobulin superfamily member 5 [Chrysochloris asiatica]
MALFGLEMPVSGEPPFVRQFVVLRWLECYCDSGIYATSSFNASRFQMSFQTKTDEEEAFGSSYQILEGPKNATVLEGSEAHFNCTVSQGWLLIMWALNGIVVLSLTPKEPIITNKRFTSASYEVDGNFVSEMIIHDVQPSDAGHIRCSLQNSDRDASAFLSVQVMGELFIPSGDLVVTVSEPCNVTCRARGWAPLPDITWDIGVPVSHSSYDSFLEPEDPQNAVSILSITPQGNGTLTCVANAKDLHVHVSAAVNLTVIESPLGNTDKPSLPTWAIILLAVSLSLLLILIMILIIIFCCGCISRKEKKDSSYQSEIRKSANVKTNTENTETKTKTGNENYGYSSVESRTTQMTSSLPPKSKELSVQKQHSSRHPYQWCTFYAHDGTTLSLLISVSVTCINAWRE